MLTPALVALGVVGPRCSPSRRLFRVRGRPVPLAASTSPSVPPPHGQWPVADRIGRAPRNASVRMPRGLSPDWRPCTSWTAEMTGAAAVSCRRPARRRRRLQRRTTRGLQIRSHGERTWTDGVARTADRATASPTTPDRHPRGLRPDRWDGSASIWRWHHRTPASRSAPPTTSPSSRCRARPRSADDLARRQSRVGVT